jgi:TatD DNase family protein
MLVDSHCHLDFDEFRDRVPEILAEMSAAGVEYALCISVTLSEFPRVRALAEAHSRLFATVGVHPDYPDAGEVAIDELVRLAGHPKVVAIGETGLDYYRLSGDPSWQRERFRAHIRAARVCQMPLVIHTRSAGEDTLRLMREEGAAAVGGVMHCFTETLEVARAAVDMGFLISFSGIVTFRNAGPIREVAKALPLERILVETDSPYLAPVPHRGKLNRPAYVRYVAEEIARLRGLSLEEVAAATTRNFFRLFGRAQTAASAEKLGEV